jgi:uncharacterized protein (DUF302 family)
MTEQETQIEIVTKTTSRSVEETVARFTDIISTKALKLFAVIDQQAEAQEVGLDLRETVIVLFGDPRSGTPVMASSPLTALDLPLKVLVWSDRGSTQVSYESPSSLAARHHLRPELTGNFEGINALTDALVAPV